MFRRISCVVAACVLGTGCASTSADDPESFPPAPPTQPAATAAVREVPAGERAVIFVRLVERPEGAQSFEATLVHEAQSNVRLLLERGTVLQNGGAWWLQLEGQVPRLQPDGFYALRDIEIQLGNGNRLTYDPQVLRYFFRVNSIDVPRLRVRNNVANDETAPEVSKVTLEQHKYGPEDRPVLLVQAKDEQSGIARFVVFVQETDGTGTERLPLGFSADGVALGDNLYRVELIPFATWEPGVYRLSKVLVFDRAGNETVMEEEAEGRTFEIAPAAPPAEPVATPPAEPTPVAPAEVPPGSPE